MTESASADWVPGDFHVGPYEVLAFIGSGGMGDVWKARDTRLGRLVAIKRLRESSERFELEARAIAALNHPNICQIYDIGADYLVLEYIEGRPLRGSFPMEEALRLAIQIARALEEAHACNIVHGDLKPGNVLVTGKGVAKLLDFGLSRLLARPDLEVTRTIEGTPAYMAPEQVESGALDARSDIFSFGALLYEVLSGNRAFGGGSTSQILSAVLHRDPEPLNTAPALIEHALREDPLNIWWRIVLSAALFASARPADAEAEVRRVLELDEKCHQAYVQLSGIQVSRGMFGEAIASVEKAYTLAPSAPVNAAMQAGYLMRLRQAGRAQELLAKLGDGEAYRVPMALLIYHLICGEIDKAADWAEKAIAQREPSIIVLLRSPSARALRASPRWPTIAGMTNLPEEASVSGD